MKLINVSENFVVENMKIGDVTVEFVHDKNTGLNYFNQETMIKILGLTKYGVSYACNKYEEQLKNLSSNTVLNVVKLKTSNRGRRTKFYSFDGLTYVVFRSNSGKAMQIREEISSVLDKMFNVVTGRD